MAGLILLCVFLGIAALICIGFVVWMFMTPKNRAPKARPADESGPGRA